MPLFEPIFEALDAAGVRYVAVGGVAVVLHGHARLTADLDLAVDLAAGPAAAAIAALTGIGFRPRAPVDPIDFEELWSNSKLVDLGGTSARIASIPDLIRLKQIAARPIDLADIEALEVMLAHQEEER
jgi:hypothetical protein